LPKIFLVICFFILWGASPPLSFSQKSKDKNRLLKSGDSPIHGIQISRLSEKTPGDIAALFGKFKAHRINTIFFRVFKNRGDADFKILPEHLEEGVYFKTRHAPVVSNLLPVICHIAHKKGLKVYAWMNTLRATFLRCHNRCGRIYFFNIHKNHVVKGKTLSPFNTKVRQSLRKLFADLAKNPVDGILFQDDLVLHYSEDMSPAAVRKFKKDTGLRKFIPRRLYILGKNPSGKVHLKGYQDKFWEWSAWKSRQLALLLGELIRTVKRVNPELRVGLNINYEALLSPENALAWFSRDIPTIEKNAHPDYYVVMSYQRQMQRELGKSPKAILRDIGKMVRTAVAIIPHPGRWIFKVQAIDWKTRHPISRKHIKKVLKAFKHVAPVQDCLMPYIPQLFEMGRSRRTR